MNNNTKSYQVFLYVILLFLIINNGYAWEILPGKVGPTAIVTDSSETRIIINLRYGGYWRSDDGGDSWTPINDAVCDTHPSIMCFDIEAYDPNADTLIARTFFGRDLQNTLIRQQISVSLDGGYNWFFPYPNPGTNYSELMIADYNNFNSFYYLSSHFFSKSNNTGDTWTDPIVVDSFLNQKFEIIQDPESDSTLFITGFFVNDEIEAGGFLRSDDLGNSWISMLDTNEVYNGMSIIDIRDIDRLSNGDLLCCISAGENRSGEIEFLLSLLRSYDNGESWVEEYPDFAHNDFPFRLEEIPGNDGCLLIHGFYGNYRGIYYSTDYGYTWSRCEISEFADLSSTINICVNRFNGYAYVCSGSEGVWKTDDGVNWTEVNMPPLGTESFYSINQHLLSYVSLVGNAIYLYDSTNTTSNSIYYPLPCADSVRISYPIQYIDNTHLLGFASFYSEESNTGNIVALESDDYGLSWDVISNITTTGFLQGINPVFSFINDQFSRIIIKSLTSNRSWLTHVSMDMGHSWNTYDNMASVTNYNSEFYQSENYVIAAHMGRGIFRSDDNCETWEDLELPNPFYLFNPGAVIFEEETDEIYSFGGVVGYHYNGATWDTLGVIPQEWIIGATMVPSDDIPIFLLASNKFPTVHISTDGGYEWSPLSEPVLYQDQIFFLNDIEYDAYRHRVWINSPLGMMWQDADYFTDIVERDRPELVVDYEILSVYPNPFNSVATAHFRIDTSGEFSMKLYNINGQEVQTLLEDANNPGEHTIQINAGNLSSGTYYLRLITEESEAIRKLVLVK